MDSGAVEHSNGAEDARLAAERAEYRRQVDEVQAAFDDMKARLESGATALASVDEHLSLADKYIKAKRIQLRIIGLAITVAGVGLGLLFIWIDSKQKNGFGKELLSALGTGLLTTGTVSAAAALVSGSLLKPEDKVNERLTLRSLDILIEKTDAILLGLGRAEVDYRSRIAGKAEASRALERQKLMGEIAKLEWLLEMEPGCGSRTLGERKDSLRSVKARVKELDDESENDPRSKLSWFP